MLCNKLSATGDFPFLNANINFTLTKHDETSVPEDHKSTFAHNFSSCLSYPVHIFPGATGANLSFQSHRRGKCHVTSYTMAQSCWQRKRCVERSGYGFHCCLLVLYCISQCSVSRADLPLFPTAILVLSWPLLMFALATRARELRMIAGKVF